MSTSTMSAMPTKPQIDEVSTVVRTWMVWVPVTWSALADEGHDVVARDGAAGRRDGHVRGRRLTHRDGRDGRRVPGRRSSRWAGWP